MSHLDKHLLKHFLKKETWHEASELLDFQVNSKYKYYNKLNFFYFRKIFKKTTLLKKEEYFNTHIANNAFYGFTEEFFIEKYLVPKSGLGLRNYMFFSYPSTLLYYSIGLYLLKISSSFLLASKKDYLNSRYGGDLKYDTSNKLVITNDTTLYYNHYSQFQKDIQAEIKKSPYTVAIKLDIQNYFENISIPTLLQLLKKNVKKSELVKNKFDDDTIHLIDFYFEFINRGSLPQSDNNIISNFLGYLYLVFGDLEIEDLLKQIDRKRNIMDSFKVIRYVDDIYIFVSFLSPFPQDKKQLDIMNINSLELSTLLTKEGYKGAELKKIHSYKKTMEEFIFYFLDELSDRFYKILHLRFNTKTELFWLNNDDERKKLAGAVKNVSEDYIEIENDAGMSPLKKIKLIKKVISNLKKSNLDIYIKNRQTLKHILKYSFDKNVNNLLDNKKEAINILKQEIDTLDFNALNFYPQALILLLSKSKTRFDEFKQFLLNIDQLSTRNISLVLTVLCQLDFKDNNLIKKLGNSEIKQIVTRYKSIKVSSKIKSGYFDANLKKLKPLLNEISLIEQIRRRVYAEKIKNYSVALNHLLNEIQLICCLLEKNDIKKYDAKQVRSFLEREGFAIRIVNQIENLFDRRNNSPVSHSGSDSRFATNVDSYEYYNYKEFVKTVIKELLG